MSERRRFERIERSLVTHYRKLWDRGLEYAGVTTNISRSGILVELEGENLEVGDLIAIELILSASQPPIDLVARLARKVGTLMGLEFVQIKGEDEKRLHDFVAARERQTPPAEEPSAR